MSMDPVSIVIKVIKIKIALNRLSRAKENAVRIHMGYPPIIPWYERAYIAAMTASRKFLLEVFCPCTIYDRNRHLKRQEIPRSPWKRIWRDGTYENDVFKNFLGFLGGILCGLFLYLIMVAQMDFSPKIAFIVGTILGPVFTLGLAFSARVRCIILLMLPQLFSSKGRTFLLLYCMILVMNHPVKNFNRNIVVMSESSTCGQQMAYNQTKELRDSIQSPLAGILGSVRRVMNGLKEFANSVRRSFVALRNAIKEILACIGRVFKWLGSITDVCNDKMGEPYRKCIKLFDDAFRRCEDMLGWFFSWICLIVKGVQYLCNIARIGELLCVIARAIKDFVVNNVKRPIDNAIDKIYNMFYFNVTIHYKYEYNVSQSKSYTQVKDDILAEIKAKLSSYSFFVDLVQNFMALAIIFVVISAFNYRRKYLAKDSFDNYFITYKVRDVDERRMDLGKEAILPLSGREGRKYIRTTSLWLVSKERTKLAKGFFLLIISGCHAGFYLLCDYGLYWLLDMVRKNFLIKTNAPVPPHLKMHVQGKGPIADMYRAVVGLFDPLVGGANLKIDNAACLPNPSAPDYAIYEEIGAILGICLFLVIFESYGLRFRHVIAACYHPKRERERAVWLYNHIIKMRGGFLKFARRQLRQDYNSMKNQEKISIKSRLAEQFPLFRKIFKFLGWRRKYCLSCGKEGPEEDLDNFVHCASSDCKAVYCMDCFTDLNNLCTVCMDPIDYGDFSDFSEERDSSEDEEEIKKKKEEAAERKRKREEAKLERRPSRRMLKMRQQLGLTDSYVQQTKARDKEKLLDDAISSDESSDESTESSDTDSDVSFDDSYQYSDKKEQDLTDEKFIEEIRTGEPQRKFDLVTTEIFSDEELEVKLDDRNMDFDYDIIEPGELELDRKTLERERSVIRL